MGNLVWRVVSARMAGLAMTWAGCCADEARMSSDGKWALIRFRRGSGREHNGVTWLDGPSARAKGRQWDG